MNVLCDTNILTKWVDPVHPLHDVVDRALSALRRQGNELCLMPQVLYEFWVVGTRPIAVNGLGMSAFEAIKSFTAFEKMFLFLDDQPGLFDEWKRLVFAHQIEGKPAHDARLVAGMKLLGLTHLLTFNQRDFTRYSGITLLDPSQLASAIP